MQQLWPQNIEDINPKVAYAIPEYGNKQYHLRIDMVTSIDGAFTIDGRAKGLSGPPDRKVFHTMRALSDVILVGANTARIENYKAVSFSDQVQAERIKRKQKTSAPIAICSLSAKFNYDSPLFTQSQEKTIIFTTNSSAQRTQAHRGVADIVACGEDEVDLNRVITELVNRGLTSILCEGGPRLNADLLKKGLIDELCLSISPQIVQGDSPSIFNGPVLNPPAQLKTTHIFKEDDYIFFRCNPTPNI